MNSTWKKKKFLNLPSQNYKILDILDEGDSSIVYKAQDCDDHQIVAIKVIFRSLKFHPTESKVLSKFEHRNIIRLISSHKTENMEYLVLEYADLGDLFKQIDKNQFLPERIARMVFWQILCGLNYAHLKGVCHRDLKAENILLFNDGRVVITDWGFSEKFSGKRRNYHPRGSLLHAAPEIWTGRKFVGPEPDIWSLGIILYSMLVGYCPFQGESNEETISLILNGKYDTPNEWSNELVDFMDGMLNIDSRKRFSLLDIRNHPWLKPAVEESKQNQFSHQPKFHLKLSSTNQKKSLSSRLSPRSIWKGFFGQRNN